MEYQAVANNNWEGGATAVAQVETFTLDNGANDGETAVIMTATAEDGSTTQTVTVTPDGVDEEVIAALWHTALAGSTGTLFTPITWTVLAKVVTGTAKVAGVPFYMESSVSGGALGITDAVGTSSAGPNDWNTDANWDTGTQPVDEDHVKITQGSYDILYGLNQSAISLDILKLGPAYTGTIGDTANGYYLRIDTDHANATVSTGERSLVINSGGKATWIRGQHPNTFIIGATGGNHAVELYPETTTTAATKIVATGEGVRGTIRMANSSQFDSFYLLGAPQAKAYIGTSITGLDLIEMNSGWVYCKTQMGVSTSTDKIKVGGGAFTMDYGTTTAATVVANNIEQRGGTIHWNAGGTIGKTAAYGPKVYGGTFTLTNNKQANLSIFNTELYGGTWTDRGSACTINYNSEFRAWGGDYHATDAGDVPWGA